MYEIKNRIFLEFSKNQKSALCNFLRALVKKNRDKNSEEVINKFFEDEKYYTELNVSKFEFLEDVIDTDSFHKDVSAFVLECVKYYDYKKTQEPLVQAQKEFVKKKRKFLQEVKMSKEPATKRQQSYYKSLCKKYGCEKIKTDELSKLELRDLIKEIIDEHQRNCE